MNGFIGEIRMFGGNFAPRNWAFCNGQLLSIAQNTALFSILGTTYGGDGRTTFALPDLRGRVPYSAGTGPGLPTYRQGARSGIEEVYLNVLQIPSHTHGLTGYGVNVGVTDEDGSSDEAANHILGTAIDANNNAALMYASGTPNGNLAGATQPQISTGLTGANQSHNNMQPYLVVHYVVCLTGTFPSRN